MNGGLSPVFTSVFPIRDFREMSQLDSWTIRSTGNASAATSRACPLRATCRNCGASVVTNPYQTGDVICHKCGTFNKNTATFCTSAAIRWRCMLKYDVNECQERGMTYSARSKSRFA